ncbi:MAG: FAD synthetase family protein [Clostridiales bacterium]|jgi:riboflavin kinase/FMN adenylyltransferase|nr:FAD synthetase family protein [Clostridiales bacterium]
MVIVGGYDAVPQDMLTHGCAMTVGKFDGLHAGHMAVINRVALASRRDQANDMPPLLSVVFTFAHNPKAILTGAQVFPLMDNAEAEGILTSAGIDLLIRQPFDKRFADLGPESFCDIVFGTLNCKKFVLTPDFRFGKDRQGNINLLGEFAKRYSASIEVVDFETLNGARISSTGIRKLLECGDIINAEKMLGRMIRRDINV